MGAACASIQKILANLTPSRRSFVKRTHYGSKTLQPISQSSPMKSHLAYPLAGILTLTAAAWSQVVQSAQELSPEVPKTTVTPQTVTSGPPLPKESAETAEQRQEAGELQAKQFPVVLDDSIPLPIPAIVEPGSDGDRIVQESQGDPFFLSFIAGPYSPPETELVDPVLLAMNGQFGDARPGNDTFAMVMFKKRITEERLAELRAMDCRILGFHPHYTLKVAIPVDRVLDVSILDYVRWIGPPQTWQKVHPALRLELEDKAPGDQVDIYVNVFESDMNENSSTEFFGSAWTVDADDTEGTRVEDPESGLRRYQSNGWMQQRLESMGLNILEYRPDIDSFVASGSVELVAELTALDFVQFVEPIPLDETHMAPHDESIPMISADQTRSAYDGGTNMVAQVGIIDSGVENSHNDLGVNGVGWNCISATTSWDDTVNGGLGHGTHVAGTILGDGTVEADHTGVAPGTARFNTAQRLFNYRRFPNPCSASLSTILNRMNTPFNGGTVPHVINNSWGSTLPGGVVPTGTEADARTVDTHVYSTGQVCVWSSGNYPVQNLGVQAAAKNALTVGNAYDHFSGAVPGDLASDSGRGPASDNRWKPNVNAPGHFVSSLIANNNSGYASYSGTSMAAPHVTGLIAQLVDHYSWLRDREPAEFAARLMATAQTKDGQVLTFASNAHLDNFGAGRVNAYRAHYDSTNRWESFNWSPNVSSGNASTGDFTVPAGVSRLVVVMHYNEVSGSSGAGTALVNNWDLWIDRAPFTASTNSGEYSAQQSSRDNTEIRILNNPIAGNYRWKAHPNSTTSTMHLAVTVLYVLDDITPSNTMTVTASDTFVQPNEQLLLDVSLGTSDYFSAATFLDMDGNSRTIHGKSLTMADGIASNLSQSASATDYLTLGDVRVNQSRNASYRVSYATQGTKNATFVAESENAATISATAQIVVDGTQPGAVSSLQSPSHPANGWSNDPTINYTWLAATDNLSGVQGYGIFETSSATTPGATLDIGPVTTYTSATHASSTTPRYFNIRTVDNSGNWDTNYVSTGPYYIDTIAPDAPTFASSTIAQGATSCDGALTVSWNAANDLHSGISGYGLRWTSNPNATVATSLITTGTSRSTNRPTGTWYLRVRTRDVAGNWSSTTTGTSTFGPFYITGECGETFCDPAILNSTGMPGRLHSTGSDRVSQNNLTLRVEDLPTNEFGYFLVGTAQGPPVTPGGSQGRYCLGGSTGRYNLAGQIKYSGATGAFSLGINLTSMQINPNTAVAAGQTWRFQAWYRDRNPFTTSNFTNGLEVMFR